MFKRHTAENMFNMVVKFFDTLYGWWREKLIGISFNGVNSMLDHVHFNSLCAFVGGLATVFTNTTSVESDFLIFKWEMDENRTPLMHLPLEGIFQAKQRSMLQALIA
ncbi:unnamed protein product [Sphagnum jensenii]